MQTEHVHGHDDGHDHERDHPHGAHVHTHVPEFSDDPAMRARQKKVLLFALVVNAVLLVAEVVGGLVFGSLALLADAAHMLSDVAGLVIALIAQALMERPSSSRHSYGLLRAESLGAQANAVLLLASTGWILWEAGERLGGGEHVIEGGPVLAIATLGLLVNLVSAWALARVQGNNLNVKGAYAHMMADALGSVGAIVAALSVVLFGVVWVDAVASAAIAALVLVSGWRLLKATTRVLMEAVPANLDQDAVVASLLEDPAVDDVHHVHLWSLSSDTPALSAHVVIAGEVNLHQAQEHGDTLRTMLQQRWGIGHSTLELECHACEAEHSAH